MASQGVNRPNTLRDQSFGARQGLVWSYHAGFSVGLSVKGSIVHVRHETGLLGHVKDCFGLITLVLFNARRGRSRGLGDRTFGVQQGLFWYHYTGFSGGAVSQGANRPYTLGDRSFGGALRPVLVSILVVFNVGRGQSRWSRGPGVWGASRPVLVLLYRFR